MLGVSGCHLLELKDILAHYIDVKLRGVPRLGDDLTTIAEEMIDERFEDGVLYAGDLYDGEWIRDTCFATNGIIKCGYEEELGEKVGEFTEKILRDRELYTSFKRGRGYSVPEEGVDTFPALVIMLDNVGILEEYSDEIEELAWLHKQKFFDTSRDALKVKRGCGWFDSASKPRECYALSMLLEAMRRMDKRGSECSAFSFSDVQNSVDLFWNGEFYQENNESAVLALDANVIPLYYEQTTKKRARQIQKNIDERLSTDFGVKLRESRFGLGEVRPYALILHHHDYHSVVWPWGSELYAIGLARYGAREEAIKERNKIENALLRYGNFVECMRPDGSLYKKRGYASDTNFLAAAGLWIELESLL